MLLNSAFPKDTPNLQLDREHFPAKETQELDECFLYIGQIKNSCHNRLKKKLSPTLTINPNPGAVTIKMVLNSYFLHEEYVKPNIYHNF